MRVLIWRKGWGTIDRMTHWARRQWRQERRHPPSLTFFESPLCVCPFSNIISLKSHIKPVREELLPHFTDGRVKAQKGFPHERRATWLGSGRHATPTLITSALAPDPCSCPALGRQPLHGQKIPPNQVQATHCAGQLPRCWQHVGSPPHRAGHRLLHGQLLL